MICLLAATPHETTLLRVQLPFAPSEHLPPSTYSCHFFGEELLLLHTGVGIASAAHRLTRLLAALEPELLIAFGCGGSYAGSKLANGDLAIAASEEFGDLGAEEEDGFKPLDRLLSAGPEDAPLYRQWLEMCPQLTRGASEILQTAAELDRVNIACGPFVTVNRVSGTGPLSRDLEERTGGVCESMEGAALAQVAEAFEVPLLELRGISNPCGTRDPAHWDLPAGMEVAQRAVLRLLKDLTLLRSRSCS